MKIEEAFIVTRGVFEVQVKSRTCNTVGEGRAQAKAEGKADQFTLDKTHLGTPLTDDDVIYFAFIEEYSDTEIPEVQLRVAVLVEDEFHRYEVSPYEVNTIMLGVKGTAIPRVVVKDSAAETQVQAKGELIELYNKAEDLDV